MLHRHWLLLTLQVLQCWPVSRLGSRHAEQGDARRRVQQRQYPEYGTAGLDTSVPGNQHMIDQVPGEFFWD